METFFIIYLVAPNEMHELHKKRNQIYAYCWIKAFNNDHALNISKFLLNRYNLSFLDIIKAPSLSEQNETNNIEFNKQQFETAQKNGISIVLFDSLDLDFNNSYKFNLEVPVNDKVDLNKLKKTSKIFKNKSNCLHYDAGTGCNETIKAHTISKSNLLSSIARNNLVYTVDNDIFKNGDFGIINYTLKSIEKVSVFRGFCKYHDNILFEAIDNFLFKYSDQQAMLYGYRSLCKELFLKEKTLNFLKKREELFKENTEVLDLIDAQKVGTNMSITKLKLQKKYYDESLKNNRYSDIRYVLFRVKGDPNVAFSCSMFPDIDFQGNTIQLLSRKNGFEDIMSFSSVPMQDSWGYLFCWHKKSDKTCKHYIRSLATIIYDNPTQSSIYFFRLLLQCENVAISPSWWDSLQNEQQIEIRKVHSKAINLFNNQQYEYLFNGVENIINWELLDVYENH